MTTQSSILAWKNSMDRGVWQAAVHGVAKSLDMTERLSMHSVCGVYCGNGMLPAIPETVLPILVLQGSSHQPMKHTPPHAPQGEFRMEKDRK